jgi:apolipoprotein N-acyltransferase
MTVTVDRRLSAPRSPRLTSPWMRGVAAVAAGALPALAFPAPSLWWLAYVALVPWLLLARSAGTARRAALDGWLGGAGFMIALHHWLWSSLHVFIVPLALFLGALWAPWGWLVRRLLGGAPGRDPGGRQVAAALVLVPCGWLMAELARSWQYLGGPWGLLGASQWQFTPALRLVSVGGVWLVSLLVVVVNTAVAVLITLPRARKPACAALAVVGLGTSAVWLWAPVPKRTGTVRIAVVQPGLIVGPQARFDREERLTRQLAGQGADLVVWGESSVSFDLTSRPDIARRLAALSSEVGADVLVNVDARRADGRGISKTSVLIGPDGPLGASYDKMRLVPFGEYIPARSLLGWATSVGKAAGEDRRRGDHQVIMSTGTLRLGPLVCFESAFPDMSRHLADGGAQLLVAQSSTSTFQHSWAPAQHASLAALRSAETWRPMVHATLTGITAVYDAQGRPVGSRLGTSRSTAAVYEIPLAGGHSPYDRYGDWAWHLAVILLAAGAVYEAFTRTRRVQQPSGPARRPVPGTRSHRPCPARWPARGR